MNFLDPTTFGAPTSGAITQQGDRIAQVLRRAAQQSSQPTLSTGLEGLARMNEAGQLRMAAARMGQIPSVPLSAYYDENEDRRRQQMLESSRLELGAEKSAYEQLLKAKEMGDADADKILKQAQTIAGDKAFDLIEAMERDIPDDINGDNFLGLAIKTAKQYDLIAKPKPNMTYKENQYTGELYGINEDTGEASVIPIQGASGQSNASAYGPSYTPTGEIMPPVPELGMNTASMTPKQRAEYEKRLVEGMLPTPDKGFRYNSSGQLEPIVGGPEGIKAEKGRAVKETALRLVDEILREPDALARAAGPISSMKPTFRGSTADVENKVNQLRSILTAENLGLMTGVLSETDLKVIADIAGGGIKLDRSEQGLVSELNRLRDSLSGQLGVAPQTATPAMDSIDAELMAIDQELGYGR